MEDINLHFTGDFNAIALANNLLAALIDNHIHHGNALGFDVRRIAWKRVVDMNDRALREITVALGGPANGFPRAGRLRHRRRLGDHGDLLPGDEPAGPEGAPRQHRRRLHARPAAGHASDLKAHGAMTALLQRRAQAEPRADAREQPGVHPRRAVRQHRARLQFGHRDEDGAEARRLRRHRSRLRRRPRRREVHRHQVPQIGTAARRGGDRRDRARAEDPRRRRREGPRAPRTSRRSARGSPTSSATSTTCATTTACRASSRSTISRPTPTPSWRCSSARLRTTTCRWWWRGTGPKAARAPRRWRAKWCG